MSENKTVLTAADLTKVKPYGDTLNDGKVEMAFTLPVPYGEEAEECAKQYVKKLGFDEPNVTYYHELAPGYTFFVVYGSAQQTIDFTAINVPKVEGNVLDRVECGEWIGDNIGRDIVVVGASIESDAHTVGIDAIIQMKGFHGHFGLERFKHVVAYNMGSQVPCEQLIAKAKEVNADAILVSQTVTQKDIHIKNLTKMIELIEAEGLREKTILICGGPRISHELAQELGYDAGFGPGKYAEHVMSYVMQEVQKRGWEKKANIEDR
ncbi:MAG: OAM dimerization domain-containing protein [Christensenellales bacterium]